MTQNRSYFFFKQSNHKKLDDHRIKTNLALASEAIAYAKNIIDASSTDVHIALPEYRFLYEIIRCMRYGTDLPHYESLYEIYSIHPNQDILDIKRIARAVKNFRVGNCGEFSALVQNYLMKRNVDSESIHNVTGDHVFVVIDRDPNSSYRNPKKWGEYAVIVDSSNDHAYPVSEIKQKLKNYHYCKKNTYPNSMLPFTFKENLILRHTTKSIHDVNKEYYVNECIDKMLIIRNAFNAMTQQVDTPEVELIKDALYDLWLEATDIKYQEKYHGYELERNLNRIIRHAMKKIFLSCQHHDEIEWKKFMDMLIDKVLNYYYEAYQKRYQKIPSQKTRWHRLFVKSYWGDHDQDIWRSVHASISKILHPK